MQQKQAEQGVEQPQPEAVVHLKQPRFLICSMGVLGQSQQLQQQRARAQPIQLKQQLK